MFQIKPYFLDISNQIAVLAINVLKRVLKQQGHRLTGKLEQSIEAIIQVNRADYIATIDIYFEDYGGVLNRGIPANKVPYQRGSGKKTSKVVQGLADFAILRQMTTDPAVAIRIAFAILNKWKKEGAPTIASRRYSQTGNRTGAIEETIKEIEPLIVEIFNQSVSEFFGLYFEYIAAQIKR